jgi:hypothetical protein
MVMADSADLQAGSQTVAPRGTDLWSRLWAFLAGRPAWVWILPALAAASLALALPQLPNAAASDATLREMWLAGARGQLGPIADRLADLGLLSIERTAVYRAMLAAGVLSTLLRLFESGRGLVAHWPAPAAPRAESFFAEPNAYAGRTLPAPAEATLARLAAGLRRQGFRVVRGSGTGVEYLAADRVIGRIGRLAANVGLLALLGGLLLTATSGWRAAVVLTPGQSAPLAGGTEPPGDILRLDTFDAGRAQLAINRAGRDVAQGTVPAGLPWWLDGVLVRTGADGPAVRVTGEDRNGQPLQFESCPACAPASAVTLVLAPDTPERSAFAPGQALVFVAERGPGAGLPVRASVLAGSGEQPVQVAEIADAGDVVVDAAVFHVSVLRYLTLDVYRAPGMPLAAAGLIVGGLGAVCALALPPRRLWALAAAEQGATTMKIASDDPASAGLVARIGDEHGKMST